MLPKKKMSSVLLRSRSQIFLKEHIQYLTMLIYFVERILFQRAKSICSIQITEFTAFVFSAQSPGQTNVTFVPNSGAHSHAETYFFHGQNRCMYNYTMSHSPQNETHWHSEAIYRRKASFSFFFFFHWNETQIRKEYRQLKSSEIDLNI